MSRSVLNLTTDDLDTLARLAAARREIREIADALFHSNAGRKKSDRHDFARRLNGANVSLRTVEMRLGGEEES